MNDFARRYFQFEDQLLRDFTSQRSVAGLQHMRKADFVELLLVLGHVSDFFVWWLQRIKHCLVTDETRAIIQAILDAEMPHGGPTHQDHRRYDLVELIGVPIQRFLRDPHFHEVSTVQRWAKLVCESSAASHPLGTEIGELRIMLAFRLFGELLTGEMYEEVVRYLIEQLGIAESDSRFYVPHRNEDRKSRQGQHASLFTSYIEAHVRDERTLHEAKAAAESGYHARVRMFGFDSVR